MTSLAGKTLRRYRILEQIGRGGMTTVFKAEDLKTGREVALKILSPHVADDARLRSRFAREVRLLQRLRHPNIVPILDFGEVDGYAFIVMPYMPAGTLQDWLRRKPITPLDAARIMNQVSAALEFAHRKGVVHRDVKPSNILIGEDGTAMLSDFGFAHVHDASISLTGSALIGTPAYMSPEACRGEPVEARSDQYSLAIVLYQMATGRLPFDADTPMGLVVKQANEPLPSPRLYTPHLPVTIEAVLVKALAKDPSQRFETVAEMNRAFQDALAEALDSSGRIRRSTEPASVPTARIPRRALAGSGSAPQPWWVNRLIGVVGAVLTLIIIPVSAWAMFAPSCFTPRSPPTTCWRRSPRCRPRRRRPRSWRSWSAPRSRRRWQRR